MLLEELQCGRGVKADGKTGSDKAAMRSCVGFMKS